jgi:hypothetical protein
MASLTSCMKKAGKALREEDRAAILARFAELTTAGSKAAEAARQAVEEQIAAVRAVVVAEGGAVDPATVKESLTPEKDRDSFTLERVTNDKAESVTFSRGEYITFKVGDGGKQAFGEIDGISHARREFSVDGMWHPFGFAYKAERPVPAVKKDTVPLSSVIDKANKKYGAGLGPADAVSLLEAFKGTMNAVYDGTASVEDYKTAYKRARDAAAVKAELGKMTKDELIRTFGIMARPDEKKDSLIASAYKSMLRSFALGKEFGPRSYMMTRGGLENYEKQQAEALDAIVENHTAEDLAAHAAEVKARREDRVAQRAALADSVKDPKTLDDFRSHERMKMSEGMTSEQARMSLTPEQRANRDQLVAEASRSKRTSAKDDQRTAVRVAGQVVDGDIIATKHTKKGHDLYVVKLSERVSREDYETLNAGAKKIGGYYSSFRGNGAIPGFQFTTRDQAQAFVTLAGGDNTAAVEAAKERRDAFQDDRSQSAAERLTEMADKMEEAADESLNRERKANTERRARFAAAAEAGAREAKAMAKTMRNVADALNGDKAKFLDQVRTKTQVELLQTYVANSKGDQLRAKYPTYAEQEKHKGEPPDMATADFATFPEYTAYRSDLASLGRQLQEVDGTKKMGDRLMKVADDVSDAFTAWAKEPGNLFKLSAFSVRSGEDVRTAIFKDRETAERSIKRSGLSGKAIVFAEKRGVNRIIMSPSEAIARGVWVGDGDKRITLTDEFGAELVESIGRAARRGSKVSVPWQFERAYERRKLLARMGIETPAEFRAALREFIGLREQAAEADKVKQLERAMVGRRNDGLDFFPTPETTADEMVAAADIQPGMRVLEPSAGMGHIAERIRASGVEPEVGEIGSDRSELLEAKGFNVVAQDFLSFDDANQADRGYTYGDVFRAPDGTLGVLRGSNGMGGDRVGLDPLDDNGKPDSRRMQWHTFGDLVPVEKRGVGSGYDRIVMNPPFSDGRDIAHVRHAFDLLKPGGRLVALMGESAFTNQNKRATEFREWLERMGGTEEKLPEGTFNDPSLPVNTGANARMVVIDKPEGDVKLSVIDGAADQAQTPADGQVNPEDRRAVEFLQTGFRRQRPDLVLDAVPGRIGTQGPELLGRHDRARQAAADVAARLFGKRLTFFKSNIQLAAGAYSTSQPDRLFLLRSDKHPVMAVAGHELLHAMRADRPDLYDTLLERVRLVSSDRDKADLLLKQKYEKQGLVAPSTDVLNEEFLADVVGDRWTEPEFWALMSQEQPKGMRKVLAAIVSWLDGLIDKIAGIRPFNTDAHLTDLKAARKAVADALLNYSAGEVGSVVDTGEVKFSVAGQTDSAALRMSILKPDDRAADKTSKAESKALGAALLDGSKRLPLHAGYVVGDMIGKSVGRLHWWHKGPGTPMNLALRQPQFKPVYDALQDFIGDISHYAAEAQKLAPRLVPRMDGIKDVFKGPISAADAKAVAPPVFEGTLGWIRTAGGDPIRVDEAERQAGAMSAEDKAQELLRSNLLGHNVLKMWLAMDRDTFEKAIETRYASQVLRPGVVWSDAELRSQFNLTDPQIALYREFRAATDKSLDDLTVSAMLRVAGDEAMDIRPQVLEENDLNAAAEMIRDKMFALAEADSKNADGWNEKGNAVIDMADRVEDLKARGYAPLMRFGSMTMDVTTPDGERQYFGMFETDRERKRKVREMQANFPDAKIELGTVSQREFELFAGVTPETLELFADKMGIPKEVQEGEVYQKWLQYAKSNRSGLKRLIHRKGVPGFSEDAGRVLAAFLYSNARQTSGNLHAGSAEKAMADIDKRDGELKDYAKDLIDSVRNPTEQAQALKAMMFTQFLGGSFASALVNMTQPFTVTGPYLAQFGGEVKASKQMAAALKDVGRRVFPNDPGLAKALRLAEEDGTVMPQEIFSLQAQASGRAQLMSGDGTVLGTAGKLANNGWARLNLLWGRPFAWAEMFNRRLTYIAAYRTAVEQGMQDPAAFAKETVNVSQIVYNAGNRPKWARSYAGAVLMTFKQFAISMVELLGRSLGTKIGRRTALAMLVMLMVAAGIDGLPFREDIDDVIDGFAQRVLDQNFSFKAWRDRAITEGLLSGLREFGVTDPKWATGMAEGLQSGLTGIPGMPFDVSGRLGMHNLIPGTGLLLKKDNYTRDVAELAGPAGSFAARGFEALGQAVSGSPGKALLTISPLGAQNVAKGIEMAKTGRYPDTRDNMVVKTSLADAVSKGVGFQPQVVKRTQEVTFEQQRFKALAQQVEREIVDTIAKGLVKEDAAQQKEGWDRMASWNKKNPNTPIKITPTQVRNRVKNMTTEKTVRMMKTTPKELRPGLADAFRKLEPAEADK